MMISLAFKILGKENVSLASRIENLIYQLIKDNEMLIIEKINLKMEFEEF